MNGWTTGPRPRKSYEHHDNRTLTRAQVSELRQLYCSGACSLKELSEKSGIGVTSVYKIVKNESYFDHMYCPPTYKERALLRRFHISRTVLAKYASNDREETAA